jgi:hypothetical protein
MKLEALDRIMRKEFGPPFLPHDMVWSQLRDDGTLLLKIGGRDVRIDEEGTVLGAGTEIKDVEEVEG